MRCRRLWPVTRRSHRASLGYQATGAFGGHVNGQARLEVLDYRGPARWRFRLTTAERTVDRDVELDTGAWQFEAFTDLYRYLRWHAAPDRRLRHEAELVARLGDWIAAEVLGPVAAVLAAGRTPVRLVLPAEAALLGYRPWELARVDGRTLAERRIPVIIDQRPRLELGKAPVGERLRMLAVFSLPDDAGALNLRRERHEIARLVRDLAKVNNRAVELRVLQYGATRQRLEHALLERPGWDVVHLSGHGLAGGLLLETDTGARDLITGADLVDLLDLGADQVKLVTLSACESAAVTAREHLRLLGLQPAVRDLAPDDDRATSGDAGDALPALAAELVARLDCAVLAMRYPVVDDFAIALAGSFYELTLGMGHPVAGALGQSLALPRVAPRSPTPGAPALSIATPALFGARAVDLALTPPEGAQPVLDLDQKLARFPPQLERFVGRVGALTRAGTALAPRSGRPGVVLHGMAGAGKTACALELAYTHAETFPAMAWYRAPDEGADIAPALTDFALALDRQLGLQFTHLVADSAALADALPRLTEVLEQDRVLIVIDNAESLLTADGDWRDERWRLMVDALTDHRGLSRLVLTSRRHPASLPETVLVEQVHALSLAEAVLLARELPHLAALIDRDEGRPLAARTLDLVQGHPKLIELADGLATDPAELSVLLDHAQRAWLDCGTALTAFRDTGRSAASGKDFLSVLEAWTLAESAALPDDSLLLLQVLCGIEDDDRERQVLTAIWPVVRERLGYPAPAPDTEQFLGPLATRALVSLDGRAERYGIHPGITDTVRTRTSPDTTTALDTALGDYWLANLDHARTHEDDQLGWLVLRAARSATPYLLRQHRWNGLDHAAEELLARDTGTTSAATLLPQLTTALDHLTPDTDTALRLALGRTHARALTRLDPHRGETHFRDLLRTAHTHQHWTEAHSLTGNLITYCLRSGRLDEALTLTDQATDYTRRACYGPWTQLADQGRRLQILWAQGRYRQVLNAVEDLRRHLHTLPDPPDPTDHAVIPWNIRETLIETGAGAALDLGHWQHALDLNTERVALMRQRAATAAELATAQFADYGALLGLDRLAEARDLLLRCRETFDTTNNTAMLGKTIGALAHVEAALGRPHHAIDLQKDALRYVYLTGDPRAITVDHHNLAAILQRTNADLRHIWANYLAAATARYQTGDGQLATDLTAISRLLATHPDTAPTTITEVTTTVDHIDGVHLADLLTRLPGRAPTPQAAMDEVLRLARDQPR